MAQSVERRIGSAEVTGSIPVTSLKKELRNRSSFSFCFIHYFLDNLARIRCNALSTTFSVFPNCSAIAS